MLAFALGFAFLTGAIAEAQPGNTINVVVSGLRNNNGTVRCGLFNSAATFPKDGQEFSLSCDFLSFNINILEAWPLSGPLTGTRRGHNCVNFVAFWQCGGTV
jgi:uncharacterized protein (DUF2141 family)